MSSDLIFSLYQKKEEDENIFPLIDSAGIHVIRKYSKGTIPAKKNYRMFIRFYVDKDNIVGGGVDMVKESEDPLLGYPIVSGDKDVLGNIFSRRKYSNFILSQDEEIIFNNSNNKILFRKKNYTVNEFIDILVKNHCGRIIDMFWKSRFVIFCKNFFILEPVFWMAGLDYKKDKMTFLLQSSYSLNLKWTETKLELPSEPFFKYFKIYTNTLFLFVVLMLNPLFWLSLSINSVYFTITNPFIIFSAFFIFAILQEISSLLFVCIKTKREQKSFIYRLSESTLNMKGKLRT